MIERLEKYSVNDMIECWRLLNRKENIISVKYFNVRFEEAVEKGNIYVRRGANGMLETCIHASIEYDEKTGLPVFLIQEVASIHPLKEVLADLKTVLMMQGVFTTLAAWHRQRSGDYAAILDWKNNKFKIKRMKEAT